MLTRQCMASSIWDTQYKASILRPGVNGIPTNSTNVKTAKDNRISISGIIKIIKPRNKKLESGVGEEDCCKDYIKTNFSPLLLLNVCLT